jgi:hypothetical protein
MLDVLMRVDEDADYPGKIIDMTGLRECLIHLDSEGAYLTRDLASSIYWELWFTGSHVHGRGRLCCLTHRRPASRKQYCYLPPWRAKLVVVAGA